MFDDTLLDDAKALLAACQQRNWMLATAESCTGGLIAGLLTEIAGSSAVVDRGFVTYSNEAKQQMLGVPADMLARHGAVSAEVAVAMARGALEHSQADIAIAVTGVAGPGGGTVEKPVGLVHIASAVRDGRVWTAPYHFEGDRSAVRLATVRTALVRLQAALGQDGH